MVLLLDDEHLESLQCSRCHKYLSMFPVKNHSNRDVTCGRCSGIDADEEDSVRSTLYELVAEKYLFKCVNRFEGCRKLLRADETEDHEKECVGNVFNCPKCEDGIERSVLELIWHYKFQHPSSYLRKNCLDMKVPMSNDVMLYVLDDVVFFIFIRCDLNVLQLSATTLTELNITQTFFIKKGAVWERSENTPCKIISAFNGDYCHIFNLGSIESVQVIFYLEVSKQGGKLYDVSIPSTSRDVDRIRSEVGLILNATKDKTFRIRLSESETAFKLNDKWVEVLHENGQEIDLTCSNCKQLLGRSRWRCIMSKHPICNDCHLWCSICDTDTEYDETNNVLIQVADYLKFACKWKCGEYFTGDLQDHEKFCKLRIFKCQICSLEIKSLDLLKSHLFNKHQISIFCGDYSIDEIDSVIKRERNGELCFLCYDMCCYLKWFQNDQHPWYDFHFGLYSNEPNVKLGMYKGIKMPDGMWSGKCFYNVIRNVNVAYHHTFHTYHPYINFHYVE